MSSNQWQWISSSLLYLFQAWPFRRLLQLRKRYWPEGVSNCHLFLAEMTVQVDAILPGQHLYSTRGQNKYFLVTSEHIKHVVKRNTFWWAFLQYTWSTKIISGEHFYSTRGHQKYFLVSISTVHVVIKNTCWWASLQYTWSKWILSGEHL